MDEHEAAAVRELVEAVWPFQLRVADHAADQRLMAARNALAELIELPPLTGGTVEVDITNDPRRARAVELAASLIGAVGTDAAFRQYASAEIKREFNGDTIFTAVVLEQLVNFAGRFLASFKALIEASGAEEHTDLLSFTRDALLREIAAAG